MRPSQSEDTLAFKIGAALVLSVGCTLALMILCMMISLAADIGYWIRSLIF